MKKFFSLVLALVMALSLTTVAWGVSSAADLQDAIDNAQPGDTITLTGNITDATSTITIDKPLILDGATFAITSTADWAINIKTTGNVTIKNLTLTTTGERGIQVEEYPANLTLDNVDATAANYTVNMRQSAGAAKIAINNCELIGLCTINVWGADSEVTITGGKIVCNDQNDLENYCALCLNYTATGATITATGVDFDIEGDSYLARNSTTDGEVLIDGSGSDVRVFVASVQYGDYAYLFPTVQDAINHAVANSQPEVVVLDTAVNSGESFTVPAGVNVTMPTGAEMVDDGTGNMMVAPAGTSGGAVATKFYVADDAAADDWKLLASFPGDDLSDFAKDSSDNFLPCYEVPNYGFFTEVKAANGAYKLTYGAAKVVYLAPVDYSDVHYDYKATALKVVDEDDAECGDWFVTGLDEDDKYYAAYTKKGEVEGVFVAEKNGSMQILVGGKIVDVEWQDIGTDVEWKLHQFKGYDVVNGEYTTVKCENCPKVAKLYANATAATIGKKEPVKLPNNLGWVTLADFFDFGANAPVVTDKDDKVTSAETFDAGIAMYVGMSVMAAAGSAVVIGKKRED